MAPGTAFFRDSILSSESVLMMTSFMMGLLSFLKLFLIIAWFRVHGLGFSASSWGGLPLDYVLKLRWELEIRNAKCEMVVRRKTIMKRRTFLEMGHHASQSPHWGRLRNENTAIEVVN